MSKKPKRGAPLLAVFREGARQTADTTLSYRTPYFHLQYVPIIDAHFPGFAQEIRAETTPLPKFRRRDQPSRHRIPMHVTKFLDPLVPRPNTYRNCLRGAPLVPRFGAMAKRESRTATSDERTAHRRNHLT